MIGVEGADQLTLGAGRHHIVEDCNHTEGGSLFLGKDNGRCQTADNLQFEYINTGSLMFIQDIDGSRTRGGIFANELVIIGSLVRRWLDIFMAEVLKMHWGD